MVAELSIESDVLKKSSSSTTQRRSEIPALITDSGGIETDVTMEFNATFAAFSANSLICAFAVRITLHHFKRLCEAKSAEV